MTKVKIRSVILVLACAWIVSTPVLADEMSELKAQLEAMQQQIQIMQVKLKEQEVTLKQQEQKQQQVAEVIKHQQASDHTGTVTGMAGEIVESVIMSGAIEVNTRSTTSAEWSGDSSSDIILDTLEMGFEAHAGDWISGNILFLYEQDPGPGREGDELLVDEAYITIGNPGVSPFYGAAGRIYVPFGNYESHMITDPATLTLGETRAEVLQAGFQMENGLYGSGYLYNGDILQQRSNYTSRDRSTINNYGLNIGYTLENDNYSLDVGAGYMNNISTTDGLTAVIEENNGLCNGDPCVKNYVGGVSLHAVVHMGQFSLLTGYISALDDFQSGELSSISNNRLKPQAFNLEGTYHFSIANKESTFALGYQKTRDMYFDDSQLYYFEQGWFTSLSVGIFENTMLAAEWAHLTGYDEVRKSHIVKGERFDDADVLQVKLSYVF